MARNECILPADLWYGQRGSVWARLDGRLLVSGLTHPQLCLIGRPTAIRFPNVSAVGRGGYLAIVETRRFYGPVLSPVEGVVAAVNTSLYENPSLVAEEPYGAGWLVKLEAGRWDETCFEEADEVRMIFSEMGIKCFRYIPDYSVSGVGGECPETLTRLSEMMARLTRGERVHLMTDNPRADADVDSWANLHGYVILEKRCEGLLRHFIIGKS